MVRQRYQCAALGLLLATSANDLSCSRGRASSQAEASGEPAPPHAGTGPVVADSPPTKPLPPRVDVPKKWSFGVIADTQWVGPDDGSNPNSTAVGIINQINDEFIRHGVKLVIAVGDLTDQTYAGHPEYLDTRATYAQALYNAGIAFYPLRGNHDEGESVATEFVRVFPQTRNGANNRTPKERVRHLER